jgi:pimeloyl-ACP methyl ester carboxylesterase
LRGNRSTALSFTSGLRDHGFDVLTFDFRNHGESTTESGYKRLPWATCRETVDVQAPIDFFCQRDSALAGRIVLFGLSRGASAALCVAAIDPRVRAAILDGVVFTQQVQLFLIRRFMHLHLKWFPQLSRLPDCLLGLLVFWCNQIIQKRKDCRIFSINHAARRMRKPVLLIHGARDSLVPLETVYSLRKRMRSRPRLWVVAQARHNETVHEAGGAYLRRVVQFLSRHLGGPSGAAKVTSRPISTGLNAADAARRDSSPIAC